MAKRKKHGRRYSEEQYRLDEAYDYALEILETAAEDVCKQLEEEGLAKKQAFRKTKELLKQVAKYGF